ncbi:unnamed protein product (mitochondrion) [Arabidopsis thaliana]|uniref:(thale cress) hypothetical protein n=1 Tax=Arabidopsis thaliana TaxID=3702 RepID=A0A7G2FQU7_ARATH|nr:unnamed protein product [Arabidopsis thaliana]CAD5336213.1 unnamed protein product [Arabidopsis thaliana]
MQPDLTLLGKLRSTWASATVNVIHPISLCLSWFLGTIGCSSPLPLRCADLRILLLKKKEFCLLPLFYHLGIFQHLFYPIIPLLAFCFYAPRLVCPAASLEFQRRYVVWILAVSRHIVFLENSYYIMLLHPHHLHHPHPPFLIFLFLILRKLRRNRSVKAQRIMQRSCHRLLFAPNLSSSYLTPTVDGTILLSGQAIELNQVSETTLATAPGYGIELWSWLETRLFQRSLFRMMNSHSSACPSPHRAGHFKMRESEKTCFPPRIEHRSE